MTPRGLLLTLLGIGVATALLVLGLSLAQNPGSTGGVGWAWDLLARLRGVVDVEDTSQPTDLRGRQDLSWSVCDPAVGAAGEVSDSSVEVSAEGGWAIYIDSDDIPIWSGTFGPVAFGDVTGDGLDEVIVLTTCTTGVSAQPWDLAIFQGTPIRSRLIAVLDQGFAAPYGRTLASDVEAAEGSIAYEVLVADDELDFGWVRRIRVVHRWDETSFVTDEHDLGIEDYWS